jgi:2-polyprenyl-3-methyl-5-hydroxy-6-metoxy-1,4-benzoquinol methylase
VTDADRDADATGDDDAAAVNARAVAENQALWDEWTAIHERSDFYQLDAFRQGGIRIRPHELEDIGPVVDQSLLHLQCHFGIDTLSFARLGARVTGADFSLAAIELASRLADELGFADARFVRSTIDDLPDVLDEQFDLVYTSGGVLGWLPDIRSWARVVAHFVKPGGRFYISEIHPVANVFENEGVGPGELVLRYPYWEHRAPLRFETHGSYADPTAQVNTPYEHGWDHGLGEIVTALVDAGLEIRALREFPFLNWKLDFLERHADGTWRMPSTAGGELPLTFSILATKREG